MIPDDKLWFFFHTMTLNSILLKSLSDKTNSSVSLNFDIIMLQIEHKSN